MLEDQDWVRLKWENESFRSKPVLTFWMVGAGFKLLGIADEGGYSARWSRRAPSSGRCACPSRCGASSA
jgi:4-amino-4-deoxy-L-arabinose transferase-like glycosyltransferase